MLLDTPNQGFVVATPVGLLLAGAFAFASSFDFSVSASLRVMRRSRLLQAALLGVIAAWGIASLAERRAARASTHPGPGREPASGPSPARGSCCTRSPPSGYLRLLRRRPSRLLAVATVAYVLLAEAMLAVALARNWHATWWEWHLLMLAAFAAIAFTAWREPSRERFAAWYLPGTAGSVREVSVVFADLQGSTAWAEREGAERGGGGDGRVRPRDPSRPASTRSGA